MRADLVGAAGDQIALDQRQLVGLAQNVVFGDRGAGAFDLRAVDGDAVLVGMTQDKAAQFALARTNPAAHRAEIGLVQFAVAYFLVEYAQSLGSLGGDDDAAGAAVDAVA